MPTSSPRRGSPASTATRRGCSRANASRRWRRTPFAAATAPSPTPHVSTRSASPRSPRSLSFPSRHAAARRPACPSRPRPRPYGRQPQDGPSVRGSAATRRRSADFLGIRGREFYAPRPAAAAPHRTVASGAPRPPRQKAGAQTAANTHSHHRPSPSLSVAGTAGAADGRQGGGDARDASVDAAAAEARVAAARRRRLRLGRPPRRLGGEPTHRGRAPLQRRHRPVGRRPRDGRAGARRRRRRAAAYGGRRSSGRRPGAAGAKHGRDACVAELA